MEIGRKIYYDLATGNVLLNTGEREGSVIETTLEQDCASYVALSERVPSTVGLIKLAYGEYNDKFGYYYYSIVDGVLTFGELINVDVVPKVPQPTNQDIKDNQMVMMNGLTDIYMSQLGF